MVLVLREAEAEDDRPEPLALDHPDGRLNLGNARRVSASCKIV